jgi:hypothetical protein
MFNRCRIADKSMHLLFINKIKKGKEYKMRMDIKIEIKNKLELLNKKIEKSSYINMIYDQLLNELMAKYPIIKEENETLKKIKSNPIDYMDELNESTDIIIEVLELVVGKRK